MSQTLINKVRVGGSKKDRKPVLIVTIPANSGIEIGDYVEISKIEGNK